MNIELSPLQVVMLGMISPEPQATIRVNSKKIRILMIERGFRPVDLARKFGVSRAAISYAIGGKRPTSLLLGKLAKVLGVRLEEILFDGSNGGSAKLTAGKRGSTRLTTGRAA